MSIGTVTSTTTRATMQKMIMAFVVFTATVFMGASVIAGATPGGGGDPVSGPTSKAQCKNGGWASFKDAQGKKAFSNQGACISWVNSHGYGGGDNGGGPVINIGNIILNIVNNIASSISVAFNFVFNFF